MQNVHTGAFLGTLRFCAGSRKGVQAGKAPMGRTSMAYALVQVSQREGSRAPVREEKWQKGKMGTENNALLLPHSLQLCVKNQTPTILEERDLRIPFYP